ncbi:zinc finger CCCH domain-containing protein 44 [Populus alba]|uniref:zinc finger CCCH domain-containing protein 44 n=1 Tax=Populus alba TaxID=43335 RepID=UPI00158CF1D4|nr:zinc finger CCCH domain-containing protein 44 [Populus alba]
MRQQQEDYRPSIPDATEEEAPLTFDNSVPTSDPMSTDQCQTIPEMEDSQLVGATVSMVTADVDSSKRESVHIVPAVEVSNHVRIAENSTGKRKRGRPPRTQGKLGPPQAPPASSSQRKKRDEEDVCFICFDGGSLVLCDRRGCPKAYHPACIKRDEAFFRSKAKWNCGWHICSSCQKASHYMCYTCPYSLCKGCTKDADYLCVRGNKGFCGTCMRTIMLIENIATVNQEKVQVDFDDTTSWEYLFKVYWIYLKAKLSLTIDELTKAKNPWKGDDLTKVKSPWKGAGAMAPKQDPSGEFCHSNDNNGSFSDSFCGNLEIHAKRRKMEDQPKLHIENSLVMEKSCTDQLTHLPDSPLWATKELLDFVSHVKNGDMSVLSVFEVQNLLLEYIKRNDLRDPHEKSHIFCDSRLIKLFGKERVGHFEMLKLLEYHFLVKEKSPVDETTVMGVSNAGGGQVEAAGNSDSQLVTGSDRRRKTRKKIDDRGPQINCNPEEYAAIDVHNISLLYLKRSLMENLMDDAGKFHEKVVGSFVRIRISGGDKKQDMYRLVQVVGIGKAAESYKVGTKTTDDMLEILNLDKKEVISIDGISDQDFSEGECKRLRQSIKCGLIKRLTVGEIQKRAMVIQDAKVRDRLEEEILKLNHLRDRASENGRRKDLRECVEKLDLLKSPEERQRRLLEIPDVHADPNMNPSYDSEEDSGESHKKKQGDHARPRNSSAARNGAVLNSSMGGGNVLSDRGNTGQNLATASEQSRDTCTTSYVDRESTNMVHERVSESLQTQGGEQTGLNSQNAPKNWVTSTGSMTDDWKSQSIVQCGSYSGVVSLNLPPPLSIGREQLVDVEMDKLWHYQDPTGKTQGPFTMSQLRKWSTSGLFPQDLRVWKINEKPDESILLTDALFGRFHKGPALPDNSHLLAQEAIVASDKDKRHEFDLHQSTDASLVDKINMDHWKSVQNNASVNCNDNDALLKSNALGTHSSSWTTGADAIIPNSGSAQLALQLLELSKGCKSWSDQSQICSSLSSLPSSGKIGEIPLPQAKEEHEDEKRSYDPSYVNGNSLKTPEGKNNIGKSEDKQADSESYSNQSSGQNWRPPIKSSSGWDSKPAFVSGDKSVQTSQKNEKIDFFDFPSPTPKQHLKDLKGHTAENNHSISSKLPVLDSGCSWSTASSLVVGGATLARVAGEWGGYSPAPLKAVEEWDSNHVSASSLKPTDGGSDHASTQTPDSGPLTHSPSTHPVIDASGWQPIIPEPTEFCSLADESVSDLLAEVEAMESLGGLPSPTSKLRSAEELTRGYDDDCFSPVDGFSPAPDPGKSDAFSSTADIQIPSQLTAASEAPLSCHMPSELTVTDKPLAVPPMPSQLTAVNESLGISCTPSQSTITDEPLERSQKPSQSTLIDEPLGLSQIDVPNPQKSISEHSSKSPEVEGNTKPNDVPVNEWEKGSEIQPLASLAGNQGESGAGIQSTTPSTASQLEAGSDVQQPTPSHGDAGQGTINEREAQGNTSMVWGNGHGSTGQQHARTNGANSAGNPGSWGSQPRYGGDRFSGPRDHRNNFQGRNRDSGFGRDRSSWNKQPLHGGGNGASTYRPPPKGQRVCKFHESGYCKKGASCSYWHP